MLKKDVKMCLHLGLFSHHQTCVMLNSFTDFLLCSLLKTYIVQMAKIFVPVKKKSDHCLRMVMLHA